MMLDCLRSFFVCIHRFIGNRMENRFFDQRGIDIMHERTIAAAERALADFLNRSRREHDYFRGRLIQADNIAVPDQHMIMAAINKLNWYVVEIDELEGELEMLREELESLETEQNTDQEED